MIQGPVQVIGVILILVGLIILSLRSSFEKRVSVYDLESDDSDHINSEAKPAIKPIKMKGSKKIPNLEKINGGMIGQKMYGEFKREGGPVLSRASYNCFYILYCAIIPLGCFLIGSSTEGDSKGSILSYGELEMEKDELIVVLSKGWAYLMLIIGILMFLIGSSN